MSHRFFLEIFSEEIPARMQEGASTQFLSLFKQEIMKYGLALPEISYQVFSTPRRLAILISGLAGTQLIDSKEERRGPRLNAPAQAIEGFLKSINLDRSKCLERDGYLYAVIQKKQRPLDDLLKEIIDAVIIGMKWPKSMRWPGSNVMWARPVRSIAALLDGKLLPIKIEAFDLDTVDYTYGHRFLSPGKINLSTHKSYESLMEEHFVLTSREVRKTRITEQLQRLAIGLSLSVDKDDKLLEEVTGLVEWPEVVIGNIEAKFLSLPEEVLSTSMRVHQKYFTLRKTDGKIAPHFAAIANMPSDTDDITMRVGYEKVLKARLSDAHFFYEQDMKIPLSDYAPKLDQLVFQTSLGTIAQKTHRLESLMSTQDGKLAAKLSRVDLVTTMVGEFPELQGIMGRVYAMNQGIQPHVAQAIEELYRPQGADDVLAKSELGATLGIMDRLDTLVGFFGIGLKPTGSKDPFALRRSALAFIRLSEVCQMPPLKELLEQVVNTYQTQGISIPPQTIQEVIDFIFDRLEVLMRSRDIPHDVIRCVMFGANNSLPLREFIIRINQFHQLFTQNKLENIISAYRRSHQMVKNHTSDKTIIDEKDLTEPSEKAFANALKETLSRLDDNFEKSLISLGQLRPLLDVFMDACLIMHEDAKIKQNRLNLLSQFVQAVHGYAHLSHLEG